MKILTSRPSKIDYETYKETRRLQNKQIKGYLRRGALVYKAVELIVKDHIVVGRKTFPPFVGSTKTLKAV